METLQWTLLIGLVGMLIYVLWHRMKVSFQADRAPIVWADWEGEAVEDDGQEMIVRVVVNRACQVNLSLRSADGDVLEQHTSDLSQGSHVLTFPVPASRGCWLRLQCPGHVTERRVEFSRDRDGLDENDHPSTPAQ